MIFAHTFNNKKQTQRPFCIEGPYPGIRFNIVFNILLLAKKIEGKTTFDMLCQVCVVYECCGVQYQLHCTASAAALVTKKQGFYIYFTHLYTSNFQLLPTLTLSFATTQAFKR